MATTEEIFNSIRLEVIVPDEVHDLPDGSDADDWLQSIAGANQRNKAFFDENLLIFFTVKTPHLGTEVVDPAAPPLELAQFLSHLQITLDAKYISPQPTHRQHPRTAATVNLAPPPRSHSYPKAGGPSSIFPPHTPNPTPQTGESDRKYAGTSSNTEGTVLESFVWGESSREEPSGRNFSLMWSNAENTWLAMYRMVLGISFLQTIAPEPLLSLTVSATLREKPLIITPGRQVLADLVRTAGGTPRASDQSSIVRANGNIEDRTEDELKGLEEVNLLDGLSLGPSFGNAAAPPLLFPSTRLGPSIRNSAFSLPPVQPGTPVLNTPQTAASGNATRSTAPILRKSFLKTLQTVSGFQIRMKSVFVPYVVMPGNVEDEGERREAGSEERTVVLSVELGNGSPFGGPGSTGFAVEGVDVTVGGEGAKANLIGWGEVGFQNSDAIFPLLMGPAEQFNLLYAITFMRQSEIDDVADTLRSEANGGKLPPPSGVDKQRQVTIIIRGKPFDFWSSRNHALDDATSLSYPTQTFRSRWNCILDLSSTGQTDLSSDPPTSQDALPAPASPFPAMTPTTAKYPTEKFEPTLLLKDTRIVAGSKRHTLTGLSERHQHLISPARQRNSTPVFKTSNSSDNPMAMPPLSPPATMGRFTPTLPSIAATVNSRFSGSPAMMSNVPSSLRGVSQTPSTEYPPPTPAYPAYPVDVIPQTPAAQSPIANLRNNPTGHAVEPRRERSANTGIPQTPGPRMVGASFMDMMLSRDESNGDNPIIVSVGLVPPSNSTFPDMDLIYILDTFALEIFVFNRGERTRRFEISFPDKKRRRQLMPTHSMEDTGDDVRRQHPPGIVPLENRIRIGPLRPHTCQSVRMRFLALRAGVHSISSLTLSDVESGYSMNLKSVMDVVVHETGSI